MEEACGLISAMTRANVSDDSHSPFSSDTSCVDSSLQCGFPSWRFASLNTC